MKRIKKRHVGHHPVLLRRSTGVVPEDNESRRSVESRPWSCPILAAGQRRVTGLGNKVADDRPVIPP